MTNNDIPKGLESAFDTTGKCILAECICRVCEISDSYFLFELFEDSKGEEYNICIGCLRKISGKLEN